MKVTKENLDNYEVALTVELESDKLDKAKKQACKSLAARINIPGFRKGKAPQHVIERQLGKEAILDEAADILIQETVDEALKEENLVPFTEMVPKVVTNEEGKDFVYKVTFTPYPEVKLGDYKGLEIEKEVEEITDEDVDKQIEVLRDHHAQLIDTDEDAVVENGDFITLDFEGFMDGEAFEGGLGKSHPLTIGSGTFIPGFEDQLIGAKINEERDVKVTFPEDYHEESFAGKPAVFKCKVLTIKHRKLPELNEEFVKKVSKFETLDEFKADIRKNLEVSAEQRAKEVQGRKAMEKAVENMTVDIPPIMIENRITQLINELSLQLQSQGSSLEHYLQYSSIDMERLRESYKKTAEEEVNADLMLEEVAKREDIQVEPKELEYEIAIMAMTYNVPPKQIVKVLRENRQFPTITANVRRKKAAKFIIDHIAGNEVTEKAEDKTDAAEKAASKTDAAEKAANKAAGDKSADDK